MYSVYFELINPFVVATLRLSDNLCDLLLPGSFDFQKAIQLTAQQNVSLIGSLFSIDTGFSVGRWLFQAGLLHNTYNTQLG